MTAVCHDAVQAAFGGETLLERTAREIAKRMLESNSAVTELRSAAYPDRLVELVKARMQHH